MNETIGGVNSVFDSVNLTSTISCVLPLHMMALIKVHVCIGKKGSIENLDCKCTSITGELDGFYRACTHHPSGNPLGDYVWWTAKIAFHGVYGKISRIGKVKNWRIAITYLSDY